MRTSRRVILGSLAASLTLALGAADDVDEADDDDDEDEDDPLAPPSFLRRPMRSAATTRIGVATSSTGDGQRPCRPEPAPAPPPPPPL